MPPSEPSILVARFLRANNYNETLEAFIAEAGLPADAGTVTKEGFTLEQLLEEKRTFDLSSQFERLGTDCGAEGWSPIDLVAETVPCGPRSSNVLHVSFEKIARDGESIDEVDDKLTVATADRLLNVLTVPSFEAQSYSTLHDSPILSCLTLKGQFLLTTSMSGALALSNLSGEVLDRRRDHNKYVVQACSLETANDAIWLATAGWDSKVQLYALTNLSSPQPTLSPPLASIPLPTNPEAMLFIAHPETAQPVCVLTRRDSTFLYYYSVEPAPRLLGKQNLTPHSNSWNLFTPAAIALCPTDPSLLAVATSTIPHMKLLIVRMLIPPWNVPTAPDSLAPASTSATSILDAADAPGGLPAANAARAALALQDREAAAVLIHCNTMASQTVYSTPALAWRPDGSGVWVNSDDGVVRGVEVSSGKVVATLKGHEVGCKVRCLCAGWVGAGEGREREEWLVSGAFDQRLIVWKPERAEV